MGKIIQQHRKALPRRRVAGGAHTPGCGSMRAARGGGPAVCPAHRPLRVSRRCPRAAPSPWCLGAVEVDRTPVAGIPHVSNNYPLPAASETVYTPKLSDHCRMRNLTKGSHPPHRYPRGEGVGRRVAPSRRRDRWSRRRPARSSLDDLPPRNVAYQERCAVLAWSDGMLWRYWGRRACGPCRTPCIDR